MDFVGELWLTSPSGTAAVCPLGDRGLDGVSVPRALPFIVVCGGEAEPPALLHL